jgi:hypothetical protein
MPESLVVKPTEDIKPKQKQKKELHDIAVKIREKYDQYKSNRNSTFSWFGLNQDGSERTLIDAIDYSNRLVDNY